MHKDNNMPRRQRKAYEYHAKTPQYKNNIRKAEQNIHEILDNPEYDPVIEYSGGKDSIVVLDLVERALPHDEYKVIFGDTQMEFPDTYNLVEELKIDLDNKQINFIETISHIKPDIAWNLFGPPAQRIRWCCSVLKTAPQILKIREICNKDNVRGMAVTGIRAAESESRSLYDEIGEGEKVQGQYSFHPILHWNSIEVFLYIYMKNKMIYHICGPKIISIIIWGRLLQQLKVHVLITNHKF